VSQKGLVLLPKTQGFNIFDAEFHKFMPYYTMFVSKKNVNLALTIICMSAKQQKYVDKMQIA
jgi:hypothetical protein